MSAQTQTDIHVPALMDGDKVIVPQFWLGRDIKYKFLTPERALEYGQNVFPDNYQRIIGELTEVMKDTQVPLRAAYYNLSMDLPTLAESNHAFFGGSNDYRQSVLSNRGRCEWTSTFKEPREPKKGEVVPKCHSPIRIINRPERIFFDAKRNIWIAEYDSKSIFDATEPADGWTTKYTRETGYPEETSSNRKSAVEIFGDDASYFCSTRSGLRAVLRGFSLYDDGPFYVDAGYVPDGRNSLVGVRSCRRSEQGAEHLATPVYVMGQAEYDILTAVSQENPIVAEVLPRIALKK